jgi:signal recognition particle subunit SRP68
VLYDGALQSIETVMELPGVANDQELSGRLEATSEYFTALKYVQHGNEVEICSG